MYIESITVFWNSALIFLPFKSFDLLHAFSWTNLEVPFSFKDFMYFEVCSLLCFPFRVHTKVGNVQTILPQQQMVTHCQLRIFMILKDKVFFSPHQNKKKALCKQISFCEGSPKSGEGRKEVPNFVLKRLASQVSMHTKSPNRTLFISPSAKIYSQNEPAPHQFIHHARTMDRKTTFSSHSRPIHNLCNHSGYLCVNHFTSIQLPSSHQVPYLLIYL